jgi:hypothetical protein
VIAAVRAARDAYAAKHGHDIAAIFKDLRATQDAANRAYVRYVVPLAEAAEPVATQLSTVSQQLAASLGPFFDRLRELSDAWAPHLAKWVEVAPRLAEWSRTVDILNEVGWLPYHSAPFHHVDECENDLDLLDTRFSEYYRTQWSEIRADMESRLEGYHIDDEARETFREALAAHEAGLYRCVCRVLFPEIERMIGAGYRSKPLLEKLTGKGDLADYAFRERFGIVLFDRLVEHVYESGRREKCEQNPVPNRQAAMHGLVSYSTHKHSMNMLILTDYIFQILPQDDRSTEVV